MRTVSIAKALLLDGDGNMLVLRRSKTHPTMAGRMDLPGGLIEPNENPVQGVIRETMEEAGLSIPAEEFQLTYAGAEVYDGENRVRILYIARLQTRQPKITISWEHDRADWLPVSDLAHIETEFHSFYHDALHYIREHQLLTSE